MCLDFYVTCLITIQTQICIDQKIETVRKKEKKGKHFMLREEINYIYSLKCVVHYSII